MADLRALTEAEARAYKGEACLLWYDARVELVLSGTSPHGEPAFYGHGNGYRIPGDGEVCNYTLWPIEAYAYLAGRYASVVVAKRDGLPLPKWYAVRKRDPVHDRQFARALAEASRPEFERLCNLPQAERDAIIDRIKAEAKRT